MEVVQDSKQQMEKVGLWIPADLKEWLDYRRREYGQSSTWLLAKALEMLRQELENDPKL